MADVTSLKKAACDAIDAAADDLQKVSQEIWEHPELCFQEKHAHAVLTDFLEKHGFPVTRHYVVDTGFKAEWGDADTAPCVSVLCEYDALPDIGHACGHNLIAEVGAGAGLAIKAALQAASQAGKTLGKLCVFGTPAEEGGAGKIHFIEQGAFKGIDVAMMSHPMAVPKVNLLANNKVTVRYHGKASHAAGSPWDGINALDAAVMAYQAISNLRQQCKPTWRIHGIFTNGGAKPNIIPEEAELFYLVRAPNVSELRVFQDKVSACFRAAATATGCTVDIEWHPRPYANMITNSIMAHLFDKNAEQLGVTYRDHIKDVKSASTDMGNVSYEVPSIHPGFHIGSDVGNHTRGFTAVAGDPKAQPYTIQQAKALAMTAVDILCDPKLLPAIKEQFQKDLKENI